MVAGNFSDRLKDLFPLPGHLKDVSAPVVGVRAPLDKPAIFQLIEKGDESARKHAEALERPVVDSSRARPQ